LCVGPFIVWLVVKSWVGIASGRVSAHIKYMHKAESVKLTRCYEIKIIGGPEPLARQLSLWSVHCKTVLLH